MKVSWDDSSQYMENSGWWYTYPSEKYESQLGWFFPIYGKFWLVVYLPLWKMMEWVRQLGWWHSQLFLESHSKFHGSEAPTSNLQPPEDEAITAQWGQQPTNGWLFLKSGGFYAAFFCLHLAMKKKRFVDVCALLPKKRTCSSTTESWWHLMANAKMKERPWLWHLSQSNESYATSCQCCNFKNPTSIRFTVYLHSKRIWRCWNLSFIRHDRGVKSTQLTPFVGWLHWTLSKQWGKLEVPSTLPILDTLQKMTNSLLVNVDIPINTKRLVRISLYPLVRLT